MRFALTYILRNVFIFNRCRICNNRCRICNNGGIGKSNFANAIYNLIAHQFEDSCFLDNVREI